MVYDASKQRTLMFGGNFGSFNRANDLWAFEGSSWARLVASDGGAPSQRRYHAAAYDIKRSRMVVFGGDTITSPFVTNDLWEWDGTSWTAPAPAVKPDARYSHAMAYDAVRGAVILFGGQQSDGGYPDDTWEWDGTVWTRKTPATSPPGRARPAMAFDPVSQRVVMFGGSLKDGSLTKDTWLWDGTNWSQRVVDSVEGTAYPALSYDPDHSRVVMFGSFAPRSDTTWEWDGASWVNCPDTLPSARFGSAMAYDVAGQRMLLFGGQPNSSAGMTTNELYQRAP